MPTLNHMRNPTIEYRAVILFFMDANPRLARRCRNCSIGRGNDVHVVYIAANARQRGRREVRIYLHRIRMRKEARTTVSEPC